MPARYANTPWLTFFFFPEISQGESLVTFRVLGTAGLQELVLCAFGELQVEQKKTKKLSFR